MFEFSLVFFNQHIFDKTNFKRIVHVIAKELNLIIAQKAITQECTKNKLGAELSVIDKNIALTDAGLPETKFLFSLFYRKEVFTINLFLVSRKLEDQQIAHQICLQIFFAINYLLYKEQFQIL